ncbi:X2-like carbohydrate binding domain-containing protein [Paenibacillus sp. 11B]|uniref:X2-like carbohydrate binding domain-containing protein n=1 Tax=Paenibacillus sp. 11B TaxID=3060965 RepID=UPI00264D2EC0|nr:X2-like carbohydrate binding domain-containing protein [Paenibacillus sp. 11B]MDN8589740.1 X2-like carbohydrate binding domain-containing protein [Paenibacillus sp. 11B]
MSLTVAVAAVSLGVLVGTTDAAPSDSYQWKNVVTGAGGGFVPGIIFNESEKDLIYARTDIGGAYRWNPANESWIPLTDFVGWDDWNKNGVDALATDPIDPNRVYMAVGTYTNSWDKNNGSILRSTDRGDTWQTTTLPFKVGGNMPGRSMGERLTIDPNKNSILYFGARSGNGLWKSTDYGVTWSKVTSFPNPGTYVEDPSYEYTSDIVGLSWITFDKSTGSAGQATQTIYVGVADKNQSIYRSTNGGATWTAVAGQPTGYLPHHGEMDANGNLYISYSDGAGPYDGEKGDLWKLNTSTGVWTNISPVPSSSTDNYYGYGGLAVDAQHPGTLMVATLNSWWPDANLFRSTDGGATWTRIWEFEAYPNRKMRYTQDISAAPWLTFGTNPAPPEVSPKLGWMIGDLEIDPFDSDRMMYGTGATIYGTKNLTDWDEGNKINISVMAKGVEEIAVLDLISPPSGAHLLSGVGDVSGFRHNDLDQAPATMFTSPNYSSTESLDFAELSPSTMVRVGKADYTADPNAKSIGLSSDGGTTWYKANAEPAGTTGGGTVAISANGNRLVWSTSDKGVHYSTGGNSWTASSGIPAQAKVISDRVNPNQFYGFAAGKVYVSTNGGASFTASAATGLPVEGNTDLDAVPGTEGELWFAGGSEEGGPYGLWHSTDSGATFTKLANVEEADSIGFGKAAPGQNGVALYTIAKIDGTRGFFRSDDGGANWVRINDNQHQYARVTTITGDPRLYGRVYLGTNGRGILYADRIGGNNGGGEGGGGSPVTSSTITPVNAEFDKNPGNQADIPVMLTLNGNTLSTIRNGSSTLVAGTDYTLSGNQVVLSKTYLASLPKGSAALTFHFSAGNDTILNLTIKDTTVVPVGAIRIGMFNGTTSATSNSVNPKIKLTNTGTTAINLSDVKIRYYYTINGAQTQSFFCDWATAGNDNVTGTFSALSTPVTGADYMLEIGFKASAGSLAAGQSTEIQARFSKNDWSNYTQTDDYSFAPAQTAYTDWSKVTGYIAGSLQWGIEP